MPPSERSSRKRISGRFAGPSVAGMPSGAPWRPHPWSMIPPAQSSVRSESSNHTVIGTGGSSSQISRSSSMTTQAWRPTSSRDRHCPNSLARRTTGHSSRRVSARGTVQSIGV